MYVHLAKQIATVPELTPVYLLKVTGSFMVISEKGIPLRIARKLTAGAPQPGHKARINPFPPFRRNHRYRKLMLQGNLEN